MNLTKLFALIRHELRLFAADRRAVATTVLIPIGIASFFGLIFGGSGDQPAGQLAVLVADEDRSDVTKELVAGLKGSALLRVTEAPAAQVTEAVRTGKTSVGIVLPVGFGEKAGRAFFGGPDTEKPEVVLLHDPSKGSERQMARGLLTEQVMQVVSKRAFSPESTDAIDDQLKAVQGDAKMPEGDRKALTDLLSSAKRFVARPQSQGGGAMSMPADIREEAAGTSTAQERTATVAHAFAGMAVQGLFFYAIDAAMGLLRDRRLGVWKRLRAAPLSRRTLVAGRLLAASLISFGVIVAVFLWGMLFFNLRITGSVPGFVLLCVCGAFMAATFGLLIAALGRTEAQSRGFAIPAVLAMNLMGGGWFPSFMMPKAFQTISMGIPTRWAVEGFDAMLWRGLGIEAALAPAGALLGFAAAFLTIALLRFRWEAE